VRRFDVVVIGSGPAGQRAAVQAAKLDRTVAVIDKRRELGGVSINTGTIPSKTLREAVLDLSGRRERLLYDSAPARPPVPIRDLLQRATQVIQHERRVVQAQLARNGVRVFEGAGRFAGPNQVVVEGPGETVTLEGSTIVVAVGTAPAQPPGLAVDHHRVVTSDDVLHLERLPRTMAVVGAGIIGVEYATIFAALGIEVTLIDKRTEILDMVDRELVAAFATAARRLGVTMRLGEEVRGIEALDPDHALLLLRSGKRMATDLVLISAGRHGATGDLQLDRAGLGADERGRIVVDEHYRTAVPHIYAVGDCVGAPGLASIAMEQGRHAVLHALGMPTAGPTRQFPFGIFAIPEISWVGPTEAELTAQDVPFETGVARYDEIARGQILGDEEGMLKLIVHLETRELLAVWVLGTQATELVHIGQTAMVLGGNLDFVVNNVFNYPTLAECYKVAGLDAFNKLRALGALPATTVTPAS
jgi:NAD(P) transhydrogenase